ncbi:hypothetical protein H9P43_001455 [Blastocladiella emersonii ATCC 22665]|nr:hypothetical protein H9P43_001455 [Blastocladiella emersonii ATCC 22665]
MQPYQSLSQPPPSSRYPPQQQQYANGAPQAPPGSQPPPQLPGDTTHTSFGASPLTSRARHHSGGSVTLSEIESTADNTQQAAFASQPARYPSVHAPVPQFDVPLPRHVQDRLTGIHSAFAAALASSSREMGQVLRDLASAAPAQPQTGSRTPGRPDARDAQRAKPFDPIRDGNSLPQTRLETENKRLAETVSRLKPAADRCKQLDDENRSLKRHLETQRAQQQHAPASRVSTPSRPSSAFPVSGNMTPAGMQTPPQHHHGPPAGAMTPRETDLAFRNSMMREEKAALLEALRTIDEQVGQLYPVPQPKGVGMTPESIAVERAVAAIKILVDEHLKIVDSGSNDAEVRAAKQAHLEDVGRLKEKLRAAEHARAAEVQALEGTARDLREQLRVLRDELQQATAARDAAVAAKAELEQEVKQATVEIAMHKGHAESFSAELRQTRGESRASVKAHEALKVTVKDLEARLAAAEARLAAAEARAKAASDAATAAEARRASLERSVEEHNATMHAYTVEMRAVADAKAAAESRAAELSKQVASFKDYRARLEKDMTQLVQRANAETTEARAAVEQVRGQLAAMQAESERERQARTSEVEALRSKLQAAETGASGAYQQHAARQAELDALTAKCAALQSQVDAASADGRAKSDAVADLMRQLADARAQTQRVESERDDAARQSQSLAAEVEHLRAQLSGASVSGATTPIPGRSGKRARMTPETAQHPLRTDDAATPKPAEPASKKRKRLATAETLAAAEAVAAAPLSSSPARPAQYRIAFSGFTGKHPVFSFDERARLLPLVIQLGGVIDQDADAANVTHLITPEGTSTKKAMTVIANGGWLIHNLAWLTDSAAAGRFLSEHKYGGTRWVHPPFRGRHVYMTPAFFAECERVPRHATRPTELKWLVEAAGGTASGTASGAATDIVLRASDEQSDGHDWVGFFTVLLSGGRADGFPVHRRDAAGMK